jgi:hypothetical protein
MPNASNSGARKRTSVRSSRSKIRSAAQKGAGLSALRSGQFTRSNRRRDNIIVQVPTGYVNQAQLGEIIAHAAQHLGPEVVHVAYSLGPDSTDEPSLFFRIVLADAYIREDTITDLTGRITAALFDAVRPLENWGLRPYFNFRSKSEQDRRPDPKWM